MVSFCKWGLVLSIWLTLSSRAEIIEFGVRTSSNVQKNEPVIITLWFDDAVYQTEVEPIAQDTWFVGHKDTPPKYTFLGYSHCPKNNNNNTVTKMLIESNSGDSLKADDIKIVTDSSWFELGRFYLDDPSVSSYESCFSNDATDCGGEGGIYKKMFYFDTTQPNMSITGQWSDAMNIYPQEELQTCDPTKYPSVDPTVSPTENPTMFPTKTPTKAATSNPTRTSTLFPTFTPSYDPTTAPTQLPSVPPTKYPINIPSASPSEHIHAHVDATESTVSAVTTKTRKEGHDDYDVDEASQSGFKMQLSLIIAAIVALCTIVILWGAVFIYRHRINKNKAIARQLSAAVKTRKEITQKQPDKTVDSPLHSEEVQSGITHIELDEEIDNPQVVNNTAQFESEMGNIHVVNDMLMDDVIENMKSNDNVTSGASEDDGDVEVDDDYDDDDDDVLQGLDFETKGQKTDDGF